jgi:hypothetical protein
MPYRLLADAVLMLHFGFIAFAVGGGLLVLRWPRAAWLHLPALAWGAYVVLAGEICPLTPLENALRRAGGGAAYDASFIEHYLLPLVYPEAAQRPAGRGLQMALGSLLLLFNAAVYAFAWHACRRERSRRADNRRCGP